jgi:predicted nuclease of predicted toxin-antitoxin system
MRFLVDNNLSPAVATGLHAAGHDTAHVRDYGLAAATDDVVLERAEQERRTLISADTDFGALLAASGATGPSVLLVRRINGRRAEQIVAIILANLDSITEDLANGSVVVIGDDWLRIRRLPILPRKV